MKLQVSQGLYRGPLFGMVSCTRLPMGMTSASRSTMRRFTSQAKLCETSVVDMFVVERLNIRVKQVAEAVKNTEAWERSVLASILTKQCNQLEEGQQHFSDGLLGATATFPGHPGASLARGVREDGKEFHIDDIVIAGSNVIGRVAGGVKEHSEFALVLQLLEQIGHTTRSSARYRFTRRAGIVLVRDAREANAWYRHGADEVTVLS